MKASPGPQPGALRRELGLGGAVALGIGGTVGGGVYVLVGAAAGAAGPAALLAFGVAFAASLLIALPYAELACRYPLAGGGYAFARAVFGPRIGFLMGWGFWGAYLFISGYVTLGFGGYLEAVTGLPVVAGALCLIAACLALNLLGVRVTGAAQKVVVAVALLGLLAFAAWGLPSVEFGRLDPFLPSGIKGVVLASLLAFLAFGGFDMVAAAGEEVERPERTLPRAILLTLAVVLGLYLLVCLVAVGVLSSAASGRRLHPWPRPPSASAAPRPACRLRGRVPLRPSLRSAARGPRGAASSGGTRARLPRPRTATRAAARLLRLRRARRRERHRRGRRGAWLARSRAPRLRPGGEAQATDLHRQGRTSPRARWWLPGFANRVPLRDLRLPADVPGRCGRRRCRRFALPLCARSGSAPSR